MASNELSRAIGATRRTNRNRLIGEMPRQIGLELVHAVVAQLALPLDRLEDDPIEVLAKLATKRRGIGPSPFSDRGLLGSRQCREPLTWSARVAVLRRHDHRERRLRLEGQDARQQLVER